MSQSTTSTPTPAAIARQFAEANPDAECVLTVRTWTAKGKGGWGQARRENVFYVRDGRVSARRGSVDFGPTNGTCWACGRVHLDLAVRRVYIPDPQAGEDVPGDFAILGGRWPGYRNVFAGKSYLMACADCIAAHDFELNEELNRYESERRDHVNHITYVFRPHPEYPEPQVKRLLIDLTRQAVTA